MHVGSASNVRAKSNLEGLLNRRSSDAACFSCSVSPPNNTCVLIPALDTASLYVHRRACTWFYLTNHQLFHSAESFLVVCQENGYSFRTLADAKYATMMVSCGTFHESDTTFRLAGPHSISEHVWIIYSLYICHGYVLCK